MSRPATLRRRARKRRAKRLAIIKAVTRKLRGLQSDLQFEVKYFYVNVVVERGSAFLWR